MEYKGSCLCKGIQFRIMGEFEHFFLCHCRYCRKDSGSSHAANLFSTHAKIEWIKTDTEIRSYSPHKSNHVKAFCSTCGSALPNIQMEGKLLLVPAGALDSSINMRPEAHIFISNKASWDDHLERVKEYEKFPNGG